MKVDYEIINEKPHFGLWFGKAVVINNNDAWFGKIEQNPILSFYVDNLKNWRMENFTSDIHIKNEQVIFKPPYYSGPIIQNGTIGLKFIAWGRAYKIMKLLKKGIKRYAKKNINGKRKYVRIDKRYSNLRVENISS